MSDRPPKPIPWLHLHVNTEYFNQIKDGTKGEEYRRVTDYWDKRLIDRKTGEPRKFKGVVIYSAYRPGEENKLRFDWQGWTVKEIDHPHFNGKATVYAIRLYEATQAV